MIDEVGELVITEPMPSMPIYFWDDEDGEKLRESYFDMYPGVWRHGDWIRITERGTAVITGRSDSTINRGGIRMGTAEIYRAVLALDEITDALVVDIAKGDDAWMPLFVVLREGAELDEDLEKAIAKRVREDCSPRHVPSEVFQVEEVPRTLSGKVLEVPVKKILTGHPGRKAASRDSLPKPRRRSTGFVELAAAARRRIDRYTVVNGSHRGVAFRRSQNPNDGRPRCAWPSLAASSRWSTLGTGSPELTSPGSSAM